MIIREGFFLGLLFLVLGAIALLTAALTQYKAVPYMAGALLLALSFFIFYFFRNPKRQVKEDPAAIISPADGRVIEITQEEEPLYIKGKGIRVSIFLSVFNVHVNRFPVTGRVEYFKYMKGRFLAAFNNLASVQNEQNIIGISSGQRKVVVKQIAGLIARRVVFWFKTGDAAGQGKLLGLIRFGSRTDIIMEAGKADILVKKGDKVKGGLTVIGRFK